MSVPSGCIDMPFSLAVHQVGYAMCLKASTPDLSSLAEAVESMKLPPGFNFCVTDLVLALLLQGAQLQSLVTGDEETCYHTALFLCCFTGELTCHHTALFLCCFTGELACHHTALFLCCFTGELTCRHTALFQGCFTGELTCRHTPSFRAVLQVS